MSRVLLCLGAGYCARAWGERLRAAGWELRGTRSSAADAAELAAAGWRGFAWSGGPLPAAAWEGVSHVLASVPPRGEGPEARDLDPALAEVMRVTANEAERPALEWVGYLSSSAVYGDHGGDWVDEESPLGPLGSERARRRARAEAGWRELDPARVPWRVFRLAGIYGPGRSALDRVRAGRARRLDAPNHFARIHLEDICGALSASLERSRPGRVYNLCDAEPAPSAAVTAEACRLLGVAAPPLEPCVLEQLPEPLAAFYRDRKRLRSVRLGPELGYELRFPSYREGLADLLAGDGAL